MDMEVNTNAFSEATSSLNKHCRIIEGMTKILVQRLRAARESFDDYNYDQTVASVNTIQKRITTFSIRVDHMEKDLKTLERLVWEYTNGGYGR